MMYPYPGNPEFFFIYNANNKYSYPQPENREPHIPHNLTFTLTCQQNCRISSSGSESDEVRAMFLTAEYVVITVFIATPSQGNTNS